MRISLVLLNDINYTSYFKIKYHHLISFVETTNKYIINNEDNHCLISDNLRNSGIKI